MSAIYIYGYIRFHAYIYHYIYTYTFCYAHHTISQICRVTSHAHPGYLSPMGAHSISHAIYYVYPCYISFLSMWHFTCVQTLSKVHSLYIPRGSMLYPKHLHVLSMCLHTISHVSMLYFMCIYTMSQHHMGCPYELRVCLPFWENEGFRMSQSYDVYIDICCFLAIIIKIVQWLVGPVAG